TFKDMTQFRHNRRATGVCSINMQPEIMFCANVRDSRNRIDACRGCGAHCGDNAEGPPSFVDIFANGRLESSRIHPELSIGWNLCQSTAPNSKSHRRLLYRRVSLLRTVRAEPGRIRTANAFLPNAPPEYRFARRGQSVKRGRGSRVMNHSHESRRQSQHLAEPIEDVLFQL